MGVKERLQEFIKHLGISVLSFEKSIGASNGYVSSISKGIGGKYLREITELYPQLNVGWLLYGGGDMLNTTDAKEVVPALPAGWLNVPVVPATAQAGYLSGYGDPEYIDELDTMPYPVDRQYKGRYMCFEVRGDSMDNGTSESILSGDFVLAREVQRHLWQDYKLHYKRWSAFVIVTRADGVLIKQITEHDVDGHKITLHSLNPLFADYVVDLSDVLEIYNVVQISRKRM